MRRSALACAAGLLGFLPLLSLLGCGPGGIHELGKELDDLALERAYERAGKTRPRPTPPPPSSPVQPAFPEPGIGEPGHSAPRPAHASPAPKPPALPAEKAKTPPSAVGTLLPPLVDIVPERLGTPAQSEAKRPSFAFFQHNYAPEYTNSSALFAATETAGDSDAVVGLICQISSGARRDEPGGGVPDLSVSVSLTQAKQKPIQIRERGAEDIETMHFSLPLVRLAKGDRLDVALIDRDVIFDEGIENLHATFQGRYPWVVKGSIAYMDCRPVPRPIVEEHLKPYRERADRELATMEAMRPNLRDPHFGVGYWRDKGRHDTQRAIENMAGYVGWDDIRVQRRIERMDALTGILRQMLSQRMEELRKTLAPPSEGATLLADGALALKTQSVACGPSVYKRYKAHIPFAAERQFKENPCIIELLAENKSGIFMDIDEFYGTLGPLRELSLVTSTGFTHKARLIAAQSGGKIISLDKQRTYVLEAGQSVSILLAPDGEIEQNKQIVPMLLRAEHQGRSTNKPKEWTSIAGGAFQMRVTKLLCGAEAEAHYKANAPTFGRASWEKAPTCVSFVDLKRTGTLPMKINAFFKELSPMRSFSLLNPEEFVVHKPKTPGQSPKIGTGTDGITFSEVYAILDPRGTRPLKEDIELGPDEQISLAMGTKNRGELPSSPKLENLVLRTWFGSSYSFMRIEAPSP